MRLWLVVVAVLLAAFVALSAKLFAFPDETVPPRADAVVVLAGNWELRLALGRRLVREGVAPVLVLSEESDDDWPRELCRRPDVTCFQADPYSTYGEAEAFGELARRRGWRSAVVVTSDYHLTRARLLLGRCFDGRLHGVAADESAADWLHGAAWEWPKLVHALTVKRGCGYLHGAAPESNRPTVGLPRRTGFEDQLGHRARPLRGQPSPRPSPA